MYAIHLRARKEPITVSDDLGRQIKEQWAANKLGKKINLDGHAFESEAIRAIDSNWHPPADDIIATTRESEMERRMSELRDEYREHEREIHRLRALPIPQRAAFLGLANLIWYGATGTRDMPPEIATTVIERQAAYFADNPNDAYANPTCYRDLMRTDYEPYKSAVPPLGYHLRHNAFSIVERILQASYRA